MYGIRHDGKQSLGDWNSRSGGRIKEGIVSRFRDPVMLDVKHNGASHTGQNDPEYPQVALLKQVKGVGTQIALTYVLEGTRRNGRFISILSLRR
jgi:hypothetical protein